MTTVLTRTAGSTVDVITHKTSQEDHENPGHLEDLMWLTLTHIVVD